MTYNMEVTEMLLVGRNYLGFALFIFFGLLSVRMFLDLAKGIGFNTLNFGLQ